jgi:hypothetical protein
MSYSTAPTLADSLSSLATLPGDSFVIRWSDLIVETLPGFAAGMAAGVLLRYVTSGPDRRFKMRRATLVMAGGLAGFVAMSAVGTMGRKGTVGLLGAGGAACAALLMGSQDGDKDEE